MEKQPAHTILIVDDEPEWQTNLKMLCQSAGYHVVMTSDGPGAIHQSQRLRPPPMLALVDLKLLSSAPQHSSLEAGFEVLTAFREKGIYTLVVSGNIHLAPQSLVGRPEIYALVDKYHFYHQGFAEDVFMVTVHNAVAYAVAARWAEGQLPEQQTRLNSLPFS